MRKRALWLVTLVALLWVTIGVSSAQEGLTVLITSEFANIRIIPALGAEVIASVPAASRYPATGRSADNQWVRIDFNGEEGWLNITTLVVQGGDINSLPVADPRTIPYGGFESPRSGYTSSLGPMTGVARDWLRVRAGPGLGYPILANIPIDQTFWILGRTISNTWLQVNFQGTLGWVAIRYVTITGGFDIGVLPVDGIVAERAPISDATDDDYIAILRLMRDRLNLAQPTLDTVRGSWNESSVTGRANCAAPYPARPSDFNIANQLLAAFYPTLNPLLTLFNDAMTNLRAALDLFIEVCNQPGGGNPVGQATVIGALNIISVTDSQFAELRRRLNELIPADLGIVLGPNECLFTFRGRSEVLQIATIGVVYLDTFNPQNVVNGYCFDARAGQSLQFQTLKINGSFSHFLAVSPIDNPTNFLAVGRAAEGTNLLTVGPVLIPANGRYLLILSDQNPNADQPTEGLYAFAIVDITGLVTPPASLAVDPNTGQVNLSLPTPVAGTTPGGGSVGTSCPSTTATCSQLVSCDQATACLIAGVGGLDSDNDGVPCEENLCR
ncbi:MAG: SH3 domain-containing protein [Chloroflexi bacterium]|nr:SH3 domain-containing protein [Chloroflexota bacterium]